jgi:hypothetical protein
MIGFAGTCSEALGLPDRPGAEGGCPQTTRVRALWCAVLAAIAFAALNVLPATSAAYTGVSFEFYHSTLEPYGSWHESENYGRVWIPRVDVIGWHPYAYGHWVYSDYGWTWVSAYDWGAIPYHYGTWALDPELGWVWVPGYVWAPAWVVFRTGPSYVGWAPVPPGYSVGASFAFDDYDADHFVFVREGDFAVADVHRVVVPVERTRVVFRDTTIVNNNLRIENQVVTNRGIDVQHVERVARARVEREPIERVPKVAVERVTRDELRVDPQQMERGQVRAAAPAREEKGPREQRPDARQSREREQPPQREPGILQPQRAPERPQQPEPERMRPRHHPEQPRIEPQVVPQGEPPPPTQQHGRAQEPRGRHRGGPPEPGVPGPDDEQERGPSGQ